MGSSGGSIKRLPADHPSYKPTQMISRPIFLLVEVPFDLTNSALDAFRQIYTYWPFGPFCPKQIRSRSSISGPQFWSLVCVSLHRHVPHSRHVGRSFSGLRALAGQCQLAIFSMQITVGCQNRPTVCGEQKCPCGSMVDLRWFCCVLQL